MRSSEFVEMRQYAGSLCRTVALDGIQIYGVTVPPNPISVGFLDAATEDLDAATRLLLPPPSRLVAYHLQQVAEKLAKAVVTARGHHATREHRLSELAKLSRQVIHGGAGSPPWPIWIGSRPRSATLGPQDGSLPGKIRRNRASTGTCWRSSSPTRAPRLASGGSPDAA